MIMRIPRNTFGKSESGANVLDGLKSAIDIPTFPRQVAVAAKLLIKGCSKPSMKKDITTLPIINVIK